MVRNKRMKMRDKVVWRGKKELNKKIENGTYIEFLKEKYGIIDGEGLLSDKEFFSSIVEEIKKQKEKNITYTKQYKEFWLREWLKMKRRI